MLEVCAVERTGLRSVSVLRTRARKVANVSALGVVELDCGFFIVKCRLERAIHLVNAES